MSHLPDMKLCLTVQPPLPPSTVCLRLGKGIEGYICRSPGPGPITPYIRNNSGATTGSSISPSTKAFTVRGAIAVAKPADRPADRRVAYAQ